MALRALPEMTLSNSAMSVLETAEQAGRLHLAGNADDLVKLAIPDASLGIGQAGPDGRYIVGYDVPGRGFVRGRRSARRRTASPPITFEPYMRRRDPDCMVVGDGEHTDKPTFEERFGQPFGDSAAKPSSGCRRSPLPPFSSAPAIARQAAERRGDRPGQRRLLRPWAGDAAGHCAAGGNPGRWGRTTTMAPWCTWRRRFGIPTFEGKQVVVHNRRFEDDVNLHELFSYNLYPGPSAKKGVYGMLLTLGERAEHPWTTAHCSTVEVVTPYENSTTIMHEGASGGGKSEMLEQMHREAGRHAAAGREHSSTATSATLDAPPRLRTAPRNRRHGALPSGTQNQHTEPTVS